MAVVAHADRRLFSLPGIEHRTLAGHRDGLRGLEVWSQRLEAGARTPMHYHDCEEVVVVLSGSGEAVVDGRAAAFGPQTTLILPAGSVHALSAGASAVLLVASLSGTPAGTFAPDGGRLALPWD